MQRFFIKRQPTCLIGPIDAIFVVGVVLRHQRVLALPVFSRTEFDVDTIVLILNPLHRHRSLFVCERITHTKRYIHTHTVG